MHNPVFLINVLIFTGILNTDAHKEQFLINNFTRAVNPKSIFMKKCVFLNIRTVLRYFSIFVSRNPLP